MRLAVNSRDPPKSGGAFPIAAPNPCHHKTLSYLGQMGRIALRRCPLFSSFSPLFCHSALSNPAIATGDAKTSSCCKLAFAFPFCGEIGHSLTLSTQTPNAPSSTVSVPRQREKECTTTASRARQRWCGPQTYPTRWIHSMFMVVWCFPHSWLFPRLSVIG